MDNKFIWFLIFLIIGLFVMWGIGAFITWNMLWFVSGILGRFIGVFLFITVLVAAAEQSLEM